ncbi:MAG: hypothetical protein EZS28_003309 [Streblomastix strix]|uniref:Uncharacterized protein n=1 Tax=Streblomastix strix TaxID=222440 RepID=A0A5J4X1I6_9EUKA|nr:MAG: hypothetical protein EZS28_003309 [Streblomastix strix]
MRSTKQIQVGLKLPLQLLNRPQTSAIAFSTRNVDKEALKILESPYGKEKGGLTLEEEDELIRKHEIIFGTGTERMKSKRQLPSGQNNVEKTVTVVPLALHKFVGQDQTTQYPQQKQQ